MAEVSGLSAANLPPRVLGPLWGFYSEVLPFVARYFCADVTFSEGLFHLSKAPRPPGWGTIAETARFVGCTSQNLRATYLPHLSPDDVQPGRPVLIRVAGLVELIVARRVADATRAATPVSADPLLSAAGDSPGLERYRLAKAKHAELDLEQRRGSLVDLAKCRDVFGQWAAVLRRAGQRIGRMHPEAGRALSEGLDECQSIVRGLSDDNR